MTNIVIVEDVKNIREGLKTLIDASEGLNCIGTFENFELFEKSLENLNPEIVLIDLKLPGISGIEGIKKLNSYSNNFVIIILTVYEENENIFEALSAGASCYLVKNTPPKKMVQVIKDAAEGKVSMNSYIARKVLKYFGDRKILKSLDDNEICVLKKVIEGHSLIAIEESLKIDISEIRTHFKGIYEKLHLVYCI